MALAELVRQLGQEIGLSHLDLDPDTQAIRLVFGEDLEVEFEEPGTGNLCFVYASVGPMPVNTSASRFLETMNANLFGRDTGGAVLGYDAAREELVLFIRFHSHEVSYATFRREIDAFLAALKKWREQLKSHAAPPPSDAATPLPSAAETLTFVKV